MLTKAPRVSWKPRKKPLKRQGQALHAREDAPLRSELLSADQLKAHAKTLAGWHKIAQRPGPDQLLARLDENEEVLLQAHASAVAAMSFKRGLTPASEWLLDNFYLIQEQIHATRLHLPKRYSRELPQLAAGPGEGLPRVYHIAYELLIHLDGRLDAESLTEFITAYQEDSPLRIGELWAIPIMLRLALFEIIGRVALRILKGREDFDLADMWADRLIDAAENKPAKLILVLADIARADLPLTDAFVAELSRRLQGKTGLTVPLSWIEQRLSERSQTIEECVQFETRAQTANQVSIGNSIGSMRVLSSIDWREFVEQMSLMEKILRRDPAQVYGAMNFATRDKYRHVVEELAKYSGHTEEDVANEAITMSAQNALSNGGMRKRHVGYYLIDKGRADLEKHIGVRKILRHKIISGIAEMPLRTYLSFIIFLAAALTALILWITWTHAPLSWREMLLGVVVLLCAVHLSVAIVNWAVTMIMPARTLPRMDFSKGIPTSCRTMIVVPTMLSSDHAADDLLEDMEVRFLANHDPCLHFGLITDYPDAPSATMPCDAGRLDILRRGIEELNNKYSQERDDIFFLFHRPRAWNPKENRWMGFERKRGKLEEFNALLRGGPSDRFSLIIGQVAIFPQIRFVITLDTDTELPRDSARELVATMAHPLVRPEINTRTGQVCEGYGILQPRVAVSLPSASRSWFVKIFAGEPGLDPYTHVVSDVYQDLFQEGSFIGKGIYEVDAVQKTITGRFPVNRILSHDLIEGCHARAGLVSDVTLYEDHPAHFTADARRRHRWIRGDWQIATWLLPRVPGSDARLIENRLSGLSRWKILDNLRRSLAPAAVLLFLLLAWSGLAQPILGTLAVLAILLLPIILSSIVDILHKPADLTWLHNARHAFPGIVRQLAQVGLTILFLPYDTVVSIDAIARTLFRMFISHRGLLEWETASDSQQRASNGLGNFFATMLAAPLFAVLTLAIFEQLHPQGLRVAAPFVALWLTSPFIAWWISRPLIRETPRLTTAQSDLLRRTARRTWRFFETFVDKEDNFLPPDNHQEYPAAITAHRTSPTNIGCALLANLAAWDFGYVSAGGVLDRISSTFQTLDKMERYHGHLYNWYDTRTLQPLLPLYISSVDSGNLAGMLLTLRQGLLEMRAAPLLPKRAFPGLIDTLLLLKDACIRAPESKPWHSRPVAARVESLIAELNHSPATLTAANLLLKRLSNDAALIQQALATERAADVIWASEAFCRQIAELQSDLAALAPWITLPPISEPAWSQGDEGQITQLKRLRDTLRMLDASATLEQIADLQRTVVPDIDAVLAAAPAEGKQKLTWLTEVRESLLRAAERCSQRLDQMEALGEKCFSAAQMDFQFLFDKSRHQLTIGYNVNERRRDPSFYDLLASECRLGSFVAIALEQVPPEHWFALGRRLTSAGGKPALLSWSGSMFEYLMPLLVMPTYDETLLDQTYHAVVEYQIDYGRQRGVPWGISESGYNATDAQLNYQYRAFGVPGLGYKRGLADDLVIAPYATVMSLMVAPESAAANLEQLESRGFVGDYGFYEAVDYSPSRVPTGQDFAIIRSFMAHHQGMSFLSLACFMLDRPMQRRFLADPLLRANSLLLQERVPRTAPAYPQSAEVQETHREPNEDAPVRTFSTPNTAVPEVHLLSNGRLHAMVTNAGGGFSKWNNLSLTRWRPDPTRDCWGSFCYVRDIDTGEFWSAAFQPTLREADHYEASFPQGRAEFRRRDADIETRMDISVSTEADIELRRLTLTNHSHRRRRIELTSYAEVVLAPPGADAAHPAFSNLFVQTQILPDQQAILCTRRPRSASERPPFLLHLMTVRGTADGDATYETDRAKFIGRGKDLSAPAAMKGNAPLSGSQGAVLDPIVAIRRVLILEEDETAFIDYVTGIAETRDMALSLIDKYRDPHLGDRVFEMAWTHSQVILRQLDSSEAEAQVFSKLLSSIFYPSKLRRADIAVMARNRRGQSALWGYGISGDLPIVLLRIGDQSRIDLVRQLVQAHAYWRLKGLAVDLVIWNEDHSGYRQSLNDQITSLIAAGPEAHVIDRPGGIFIRRLEQITEEDRLLFMTVASAVISDSAGTLAEQMSRRPRQVPAVPLLESNPHRAAPSPVPAAPRQLEFFNGLGGMTPDGKEYIITTDWAHPTPAPWSNVIANARIGTVVSESGSAYSFAENAHEFRLTPWTNDSVSDPAGEAFYLRDEETGEVWSPSPAPAQADTAYTTRHGFGYTVFECNYGGIRTELWIYVAVEAPVKFAVLKIDNQSHRARSLSITGYWEWVLAELRAKSLMHVVTEIDARTGAIFARNAFNTDFSNHIAFVDVAEPFRTFTGDREEFIGRNGTMALPAALRRVRLSGKVGAGLDPCAALQVPIEMAEGQQREVVFVLGAGNGVDEARELVQRFRNGPAARRELEAVWDFWNRTLGGVHVETPDAGVNMLANGWLVYQVLSCRFWARSGFYQSGGAYGFRDQLQDAMALIHATPVLLREHLLRCAGRQFREGDVQHWWHPPTGRGVRTKFSDDFLWLPLAAARYVAATGDTGVLNERTPFLEGRPLKPEEESYYDLPNPTTQTATLYEHCVKAIENGLRFGEHGLPLMGCGDWNDGMNLVGQHGKGESVWLAFFLDFVMGEFSAIAKARGDEAFVARCAAEAVRLRANIEAHGWDGQWYRRAYFDDGTPLGSASNPECQIDALPQSWAVISGAGDPQRTTQAMQAVDRRLVHRDTRLIQLFAPPFDKSGLDPGYIKGYVPGVRENGGQYTHAAVWTVMAFAIMGDHERAWELFALINPLMHGNTSKSSAVYKVEPYVVAADIYAVEPHVGRGGWTWYTGSAGWMYRLIVETLLGLHLEVDRLRLNPRIPATWQEYKIHYRFRETAYELIVRRSANNPPTVIVDGVVQPTPEVGLVNDRAKHVVEWLF